MNSQPVGRIMIRRCESRDGGLRLRLQPARPTGYGSCCFQNLVKRAAGTVSPVERNVRKCSKNKQTEAGCSNPILPGSI